MRSKLLILLLFSAAQLSYADGLFTVMIVTETLSIEKECPVLAMNPHIVDGDLDAVKRELDSWTYYFSSFLRNYEIAKDLALSAKVSRAKTGEIASFLLENVDKGYVLRPDCILDDALTNGHHAIAEYVLRNFADEDYRASALVDALDRHNPIHFETLLKAGLDPNQGLIPPLHFAIREGKSEFVGLLLKYGASTGKKNFVGLNALDVALASFENGEDENITIHRMYILRRVIRRADAEMISGYKADVCSVDQKTRERIALVLKEKQIVTAPCGLDELTEE